MRQQLSRQVGVRQVEKVSDALGSRQRGAAVDGGPRTRLTAVDDPRGLAWASDDELLLTPDAIGGVVKVSINGGQPSAVTTPTADERTHRWPQMLPGGRAFIYTVGSFVNPDSYLDAHIELQRLDDGERHTLIRGAEAARYVSSGHLIFARGGALFAVPFDLQSLTAGERPVQLLQGVAGDATTGAVSFDVSDHGVLAFVATDFPHAPTRPAVASGTGEAVFLDVAAGAYADPSVSPDGRSLALSVIGGGGRDVWVYRFDRRTFTRLTFGGQNYTPSWSSDSRWIYFTRAIPTGEATVIARRLADGSRDLEEVVTVPSRIYLGQISRDSTFATFDMTSASTRGDIAAIRLEPSASPTLLIAGPFGEFTSRISPDGLWIAYEGQESGRSEVYVRSVDANGGGRWQVSSAGGREPKWSADGKTLYYRFGPDLFAVPIEPTPVFRPGTPFRVRTQVYDPRLETGLSYDVLPDGKFVVLAPADERSMLTSVRLISNWFQEISAISAGSTPR